MTPWHLRRRGFTDIDDYIREVSKDPKMREQLGRARRKLWRWMRVRGLKK